MDDNDLKLKDNPVIADFQDYVQKMKEQRGLNLSDPKLDCMMLAEECGEMMTATVEALLCGAGFFAVLFILGYLLLKKIMKVIKPIR